jgi:glycosyltransferase involved in cell wall biosynthesis
MVIGLLLSGELFEDFFDPLRIDLEVFRTELNGGWLFGYIQALKRFDVHTVLFLVSARVSSSVRLIHGPTGTPTWILPAPRAHQALRARTSRLSRAAPKGRWQHLRKVPRKWDAVLRHAMPYLATPIRLLARELHREGCNLILCQEYESPRFDLCVLLGKAMGLPVFAAFHGANAQKSRFERILRPLTLDAAHGLIIAQEVEAERVRARYGIPSVKIQRIFNPLDCSAWAPVDRFLARRSLGLPADARVVAWHGRVDVRTKGLDILVEAWGRLSAEFGGRKVRLILVGAGEDGEELTRLLSSSSNVLWIDEFTRDNHMIRQYLSAADVYAFPSRNEGFPVALMEAMACAVPVVAADIPGVRDVLEGGEASGGVIVPPEDPAAMAHALCSLLADHAWAAELGRRGRQRIEQSFSLEAIGRQLRDFLFAGSA